MNSNPIGPNDSDSTRIRLLNIFVTSSKNIGGALAGGDLLSFLDGRPRGHELLFVADLETDGEDPLVSGSTLIRQPVLVLNLTQVTISN